MVDQNFLLQQMFIKLGTPFPALLIQPDPHALHNTLAWTL
jgi:hypothetical protein